MVRENDRSTNLLECFEIRLLVLKVIAMEAHMLLSRSTPVTTGPIQISLITGLSTSEFFTGSTAPFGPCLWFFSFMIILQTVGPNWRVISSSQGLYLNTRQHEHRINTYTYQTSMPCVEFEPTIPASDQPAQNVYTHINTQIFVLKSRSGVVCYVTHAYLSTVEEASFYWNKLISA
jgi:hypothetical protein